MKRLRPKYDDKNEVPRLGSTPTEGFGRMTLFWWIRTQQRMPTFGWYHERRKNKLTDTNNRKWVDDWAVSLPSRKPNVHI